MSPHASRIQPRVDENVWSDAIEQLEAVFSAAGARKPEVASARSRAEVILQATANGDATGLAVVTFAGDIVGGLAQRDRAPHELTALVATVASVSRLPHEFVASGVCLQAMRDPRLLELPPRAAVEAQLRMLFALAPVQEVSLWTTSWDGRVECVAFFGEGTPTRRVRAEARRLLHRDPECPGGERALIHAVPVLGWQRPFAALVVRSKLDARDRSLALAREAVAMVRAILERKTLLERNVSTQDSLVESSERRLSRLGFDLHDGAIQDLAALASDVRLFREQLGRVLSDDDHHDLLLGRVDDLEARLTTINRALRELARSFEPTAIRNQPLPSLLEREVAAFGARTDVHATLDLKGDLSSLTASQRIALLRVVQEALTNVREHSGANEVRVAVVRRRGSVQAEVVDNGCGFDVERTLIRAAKKGRLGLVGMNERVRLLGGSFDVQSRPGGPTTISLALPEWRPFSDSQIEGQPRWESEPA